MRRSVLNGLDLFSGIGGLSIALRDWVRPVGYCEIDPYSQGVLLSRISDRRLGLAPIWDDIRTFGRGNIQELAIDIIYGGFPCQDISVSGIGKGLERERSGLFFEIVRLAKEIKPKFIFLENVPAISSRGGLQVVRTIAEMGYDCRWCVVSAASVGAPHKRERWFLLAHSHDYGSSSGKRGGSVGKCPLSGKGEKKQEEGFREAERASGVSSHVAHAKCAGLEGRQDSGESKLIQPWDAGWWETEPAVGRVVDGLPNRVDRIKCLGNSVVAAQAKKAFKILMGITQ